MVCFFFLNTTVMNHKILRNLSLHFKFSTAYLMWGETKSRLTLMKLMVMADRNSASAKLPSARL